MQFWLRELRANVPVAIHVLAHQIAAVVAQKDAIRIHHGHNLEDEVIPQNAGNGMIAHQELDQTLAHVRGWSFAGVRPAENHNHPDEAAIQAIRGALFGSHMVDGQQVHIAILLNWRETNSWIAL